ncbi:hypothetical protein MVLG_05273 [Microbotryum lychnidis-dioicae p1A1 Lamole]|uniref:Uncharacterized protein n=1 Tax=Microbotryum lychnidis-dioicae (strain p1A1 Lamole / MvSl-1064) TaxID=683840 RepID=U5HDR6_USTV1|nr:hypothetical protein MVLG_05273 [Microbotryum lychnidis-dioicae p1A1 Lamole]|eukprot:KDE04245.1 hypothetical protein MVLG_05273 [Microbotryum lychnidis-dioicae p1A1 Lamole]
MLTRVIHNTLANRVSATAGPSPGLATDRSAEPSGSTTPASNLSDLSRRGDYGISSTKNGARPSATTTATVLPGFHEEPAAQRAVIAVGTTPLQVEELKRSRAILGPSLIRNPSDDIIVASAFDDTSTFAGWATITTNLVPEHRLTGSFRWTPPSASRWTGTTCDIISITLLLCHDFGNSPSDIMRLPSDSGACLTHGLEGNADRIGLDMVYKAAKNISPLGKAPRRPFELPDLDCLIRLLEVSEPEDLAVIACAAVSFYGMARIGELTVSSPEDPSHPPITPSTVRMHPSISALRVGPRIELHLPFDKVQRHQGDFIAPQSGKGPCPYNLLSLHLQTDPPQDQPLFSYQSKGRWVPLTRSRFLSRVNQTLKAAMV